MSHLFVSTSEDKVWEVRLCAVLCDRGHVVSLACLGLLYVGICGFSESGDWWLTSSYTFGIWKPS